ncbi:MAG TPA: polyphenol oxidase family protein [Rectinemataceae bacterium]|nr:polyphenol oxidase family protein [Rectinemataceae bacterium]
MEIKTISPEIGDDIYLEFGFGLPGGPRAILSTLAAGNMKFDPSGGNQARERFIAGRGIERARLRPLSLKHTRRVIFQERGESMAHLQEAADALGGADGLVVEDPVSIPALTVADCMPIWLYDARREVFGLLHSGWKGTGILAEAVLGMTARFGSRPDDISAILGPSIGACCYAVPEERSLAFGAEFGKESVRAVRANSEEGTDPEEGAVSFRIDLRAANINLAESLGIGNLLDVRLCTSCSPTLGSFRRQGAAGFTRMLALCGYF